MTKPIFVNEAQPTDGKSCYRHNGYKFTKPSRYLFIWSRLFQSVISQAATFMLTGKFHDQHCSIYKCEGGCHTTVGDLVLGTESLYFDGFYSEDCKLKREDAEQKIRGLVEHVVLNWDPMNPIENMLYLAAKYIGTKPKLLRAAINKSSNGGVFGGNALSDFFDWNPFSDPKIDREYQRWCMKKFEGKSDKDIDTMYADIDLGKSLRERVNAAIKQRNPGEYNNAMCCRPQRNDKGELHFWVNTGTSTQIDGWKTREDLEKFISSGEKLKQIGRY